MGPWEAPREGMSIGAIASSSGTYTPFWGSPAVKWEGKAADNPAAAAADIHGSRTSALPAYTSPITVQ